MNDSRLIKISKYLSRHLRHQPAEIGIKLAPGGWVGVDQLLAACHQHKFTITRQDLDLVVASNDKKRFSFDSTGTLIRANQGHSVEIDLQLEPQTPPDILYHGTGHKSVDQILEMGLLKMSRHHVHLSADIGTAKKVGARHGKAVVLTVDAAKMHLENYIFYCSDNGVWLVDGVPPQYLQREESK
jgi:putative RNA 2'-phosphotransferase